MVRCTPRYVVMDTNVFIDYLPLVRKHARKQAFNPIVPLKDRKRVGQFAQAEWGCGRYHERVVSC